MKYKRKTILVMKTSWTKITPIITERYIKYLEINLAKCVHDL